MDDDLMLNFAAPMPTVTSSKPAEVSESKPNKRTQSQRKYAFFTLYSLIYTQNIVRGMVKEP